MTILSLPAWSLSLSFGREWLSNTNSQSATALWAVRAKWRRAIIYVICCRVRFMHLMRGGPIGFGSLSSLNGVDDIRYSRLTANCESAGRCREQASGARQTYTHSFTQRVRDAARPQTGFSACKPRSPYSGRPPCRADCSWSVASCTFDVPEALQTGTATDLGIRRWRFLSYDMGVKHPADRRWRFGDCEF